MTVTSRGDSRAPQAPGELAWEDYARAERFLPWNAEKCMFGMSVTPNWLENSGRFWYQNNTSDGTEFVIVDPARSTTRPAFDHVRLAAALSTASGTPHVHSRLPLQDVVLLDGAQILRFTVDDVPWTCDLNTYTCTSDEREAQTPAGAVRSPDGKWDAFARDHNLWLRSTETGEERSLTQDGESGHDYGVPLQSPLYPAGLAAMDAAAVIWSPDSSKLLSVRIDHRDALRFHLVQSVPMDGQIRPKLHSYAYPLPGDEAVPMASVLIFNVDGTRVDVQIDPLPMLYYGTPLDSSCVSWGANASKVHLFTRDRGYQSHRLRVIDAATGEARTVIEECAGHAIDPFLAWASPSIRILGDGAEITWYSQRDGWGHLYLYNGLTGELIRQLTSGAWVVAEVIHIDEEQRWIYFTATGREPGRDPYLTHLYRVSLDGGEPTLLTPEDADHSISFSPDGRYFVDDHSRVDLPPASVLRAADGTLISVLGQADVDLLCARGWNFPERFSAKARDGVTDVYGVIFRPSHFDPEHMYPVIDSIYAGPQVNQAPTSFADATRGRGDNFWQAQALAELGFIVVMIDGLGMPGRSKAYHDVAYHNLGDAGLPDHIAALHQLADRYPYFDLSRVGIFGHSAGGYASAHAILTYPEFYKVCVSSSGNHDHRLDKASWVERYMGLPVADHYREQANQTAVDNLQGKLLLIHGDMDENVHVSSTLVVVDALIKANKDFDLLIMPNRPHRCGNDPYFIRKRWDYFVTHLMGAKPPAGYRISVDTRV